jgi:hypothetical protein
MLGWQSQRVLQVGSLTNLNRAVGDAAGSDSPRPHTASNRFRLTQPDPSGAQSAALPTTAARTTPSAQRRRGWCCSLLRITWFAGPSTGHNMVRFGGRPGHCRPWRAGNNQALGPILCNSQADGLGSHWREPRERTGSHESAPRWPTNAPRPATPYELGRIEHAVVNLRIRRSSG